MARRRKHIDEIGNLGIGAMTARLDRQRHVCIGMAPAQTLDDRDRGIVHAVDAEDDLDRPRIILG